MADPGHPPIFLATRRAASFATGMYDGLRWSVAAEAVDQSPRTKGQNQRRRRTTRMWLSRVCMTRRMIVRRAQPSGTSERSRSSGRLRQFHRKRSGRGTPGPPSVSGFASRPITSEPRE